MGDGLQDVPISCHVADSPLAQPSAAQPKDVAERDREREDENLKQTMHTVLCSMQ